MKKQATIFDYARFIKKYCENPRGCEGCPLTDRSRGLLFCDDFIREHPEEANEIILKWCEEHPIKTRQDKFLEMFPNASVVDGIARMCPINIESSHHCQFPKCECRDCRMDYWLAEVDE